MFDGISTFVLLLYVILLLLALIGLTLFVLLVQSGIFTSVDEVKTGKPPVGQIILAYKFNRGPYNQAGQLFTEASIIAPRNKKIGIYYDDPNKVESSQLRYAVGSVLSEGSDEVNTEILTEFIENGFKIIHLPKVTYAVSTKFPHITTLSILIAVHKAYPRLQAYVEECKLCAYPFLEYYDGSNIHFWAPLSKQEEFFVPECELVAGGDQLMADLDSTAMTSTTLSSDDDYQADRELLHLSAGEESEKPVLESMMESVSFLNSATEYGTENDNANNNNDAELEDEPQAREDDQGSDDSSSSFELLKPEMGSPSAE
ncbi:hypothetical protein Btru_038480 [Bulinus truncatus]|nr:hypothetical protein Btru_038480 [Bulinus truncatus]